MDFEIERSALDRLVQTVERHGARVAESWDEPDGARFIGTFEGRDITLFPKNDSVFAMYFTVAHLYGHMVQLSAPTPQMEASIALVYRLGTELAPQEVQLIYDYEVEAAAVGRRLMAESGDEIAPELDRQYSRMFLADFHYLIDHIESGAGGPESFARFLRREPVPWRLIEPDPRPLVDLERHPPKEVAVTVL